MTFLLTNSRRTSFNRATVKGGVKTGATAMVGQATVAAPVWVWSCLFEDLEITLSLKVISSGHGIGGSCCIESVPGLG